MTSPAGSRSALFSTSLLLGSNGKSCSVRQPLPDQRTWMVLSRIGNAANNAPIVPGGRSSNRRSSVRRSAIVMLIRVANWRAFLLERDGLVAGDDIWHVHEAVDLRRDAFEIGAQLEKRGRREFVQFVRQLAINLVALGWIVLRFTLLDE